MPADDLGSVALVESRVVASRELVPVGRHQALEGLPHEDELEVAAEALVYLRDGELGERAKVPGYVRLVGRDGEGVRVSAVTGKDHEDTFPVRAGYLEVMKERMIFFHVETLERKHSIVLFFFLFHCNKLT